MPIFIKVIRFGNISKTNGFFFMMVLRTTPETGEDVNAEYFVREIKERYL
ncbi:hypothetical protein [Pyrococcus kukulkanii]